MNWTGAFHTFAVWSRLLCQLGPPISTTCNSIIDVKVFLSIVIAICQLCLRRNELHDGHQGNKQCRKEPRGEGGIY